MNAISKYFNWLQKNNPRNIVESYPEIDEQKETSVPSVYIVGDLTGIPLLKLAFWINAYNFFTIVDVVNNYPTTGMKKIG